MSLQQSRIKDQLRVRFVWHNGDAYKVEVEAGEKVRLPYRDQQVL